jgi:hypothetical protein
MGNIAARRRRRHPLLDQALGYLEAAGATEISYEFGARHIQIRAVYLGNPILATVSATPSSRWAGVQSIAVIKLQLRAAMTAAS